MHFEETTHCGDDILSAAYLGREQRTPHQIRRPGVEDNHERLATYTERPVNNSHIGNRPLSVLYWCEVRAIRQIDLSSRIPFQRRSGLDNAQVIMIRNGEF